MMRCEACGNTDQTQFEPFAVSSPLRTGWRCIACSRFKLNEVA
jgi:hypothetical protein